MRARGHACVRATHISSVVSAAAACLEPEEEDAAAPVAAAAASTVINSVAATTLVISALVIGTANAPLALLGAPPPPAAAFVPLPGAFWVCDALPPSGFPAARGVPLPRWLRLPSSRRRLFCRRRAERCDAVLSYVPSTGRSRGSSISISCVSRAQRWALSIRTVEECKSNWAKKVTGHNHKVQGSHRRAHRCSCG